MANCTRRLMVVLVVFALPIANGQTVETAVKRGAAYLKSRIGGNMTRGERALAVMALAKSGGAANDPEVKSALARIIAEGITSDSYNPAQPGGVDNYEAACVLMAIIAVDPNTHFREIDIMTRYIMGRQTTLGAWDYGSGKSGSTGDTSMTQYALMALWEATSVGVEIPPQVWDQALQWFLTRQDVSGGFTYHPTAPSGDQRVNQGATHTMSVAGAGMLLLLRSQLNFPKRKGSNEPREYLIPVEDTAQKPFETKIKPERVDAAIGLAENWMNANMTIDSPKGQLNPKLYYLYGLERYAALAKLERVGGIDYYSAGAQSLIGKQSGDGSWRSDYEPHIDTSFALLFLGRSTQKTVKRIQLSFVGKGSMVGGRGAPTGEAVDDTMMARQKRRYWNKLKTPVDALIATLDAADEDTLAKAEVTLETADPGALATAVNKDPKKLRKLANDPRPEARAVALATLARMGDYRAVPLLLAGLSDPNPEVYRSARIGLRLISRHVDAFGLPADRPNPINDQFNAAVERARKWSESLRINIDPKQQYDEPTP